MVNFDWSKFGLNYTKNPNKKQRTIKGRVRNWKKITFQKFKRLNFWKYRRVNKIITTNFEILNRRIQIAGMTKYSKYLGKRSKYLAKFEKKHRFSIISNWTFQRIKLKQLRKKLNEYTLRLNETQSSIDKIISFSKKRIVLLPFSLKKELKLLQLQFDKYIVLFNKISQKILTILIFKLNRRKVNYEKLIYTKINDSLIDWESKREKFLGPLTKSDMKSRKHADKLLKKKFKWTVDWKSLKSTYTVKRTVPILSLLKYWEAWEKKSKEIFTPYFNSIMEEYNMAPCFFLKRHSFKGWVNSWRWRLTLRLFRLNSVEQEKHNDETDQVNTIIKYIKKKREITLADLTSTKKTIRRFRYWYFKQLKKEVAIRARINTIQRNLTGTTTLKKDVIYNSFWFAKFVNKWIKKGKKHKIEKIITLLTHLLKKKSTQPPAIFFLKVICLVKPLVYVASKRVGKIYHSIPIPIKSRRGYILALKWITNGVKLRHERTLLLKLLGEFQEFQELLDENATHQLHKIYAIKQRNLLYAQVNENRTNSHYRWK